jgi:hypothetical protein
MDRQNPRRQVRQSPRRQVLRLAACAAAAVIGLLILASSALADPGPPGNLSSTPSSPMQSGTPTITWTEPTADPGQFITGYEGGFGANPTDPVSPGAVGPLGDGAHVFSVRAVQDNGARSEYATLPIVVDNAPPSVAVTLAGTPNAAGWYRAPLTIEPTCSDLLSPPVAGCAPFPWTTDGASVTATVTGTDGAGNSAQASQTFRYDGTPPTNAGGLPNVPTSGALVGSEPEFRWTRGVDATSGPARYELEWRTETEDDGNDWQVIARRDDTGLGDYVARRDPALRPTPLPEQELLQWRVRTFDRAGNSRNSTSYLLTIDSTIPPPPTITGGPSTPIPYTSPTFTWSGTGGPGTTYLWDLSIPGRQNPVRSGGGPATEVTLSSLADGNYTFSVVQVTPFGQRSEPATRSFQVDTTPPAAPQITVRPPFPASGVITFGWTAEPGAYSRWQVIGAGGAQVIGPADTPLNSVSIANLADGAYSFQVMQVDAAGNGSATTSEPFTVSTPLAPGAAPGGPRIQPEFLLPTQNAFKLRPKAGKVLPTRRPVLGWRRGPRGTKLYNVQIFRVVRKRAGAAPSVKKIYSGFPTRRQLRAPKAKMHAGTCYVWRVWPYTGTRFTPKPLGISNFCVAKASVLRKKAAQARRNAARRNAR